MLVYGPSARGALRVLALRLGAQTLNDLPKPIDMGWVEFSLLTLDRAAVTERLVVFDLTHIEDLTGVLAGHGLYAQNISGIELRYIRANWTRLAVNVQFYQDGARRTAPWEQS